MRPGRDRGNELDGVEEHGVELGCLVAALARSVAQAAAECALSRVEVRSVRLHLNVAFCGGKPRPEVIIRSDLLTQLPSHAVSTLDVELFAGSPE